MRTESFSARRLLRPLRMVLPNPPRGHGVMPVFNDWHESSLELRRGLDVIEHDWSQQEWMSQRFPELRLQEDWSKLAHVD
jgi:hypothetical protein